MKVTRVINLTPHEVTLIRPEGKFVISPLGKAVRMKEVNVALWEEKIEVSEGIIIAVPIRVRVYDVANACNEIKEIVKGIRSSPAEPVLVVVPLPLLLQIGDEELYKLRRRDGIIVVAPDTGATAIREKGQVVGVDGFVVISSAQ